MKSRATITAVIPAKNEETNIARCLTSLDWCDQIWVLWVGTDKTKSIAQKYHAEIFEVNREEKQGIIGVQKNLNWAIDHYQTDWMIRVDADEVVSKGLAQEIQELLVNPTPDVVAYGVPRRQYFLGDFLRGGDAAFDRLVRMFKPQFVRYEPLVPVHEQFKVNGKTANLKNSLLHYSHPNLSSAIEKFNYYTSLEISNLHDSYVSAIGKMIFMPPYVFLRSLFWHWGFLDGTRGVIATLFRSWYEFLLYAKYLERFL